MKQWYAVQTKPRQETVAEENLERQSFDTYLPKVLVRKRRRDKWLKVVEPLFPRYLFIRVNAAENSLAPVRIGHIINPVPDSVITFLKALENPDTQQHHADEWPHQPGDRVDVLEDP